MSVLVTRRPLLTKALFFNGVSDYVVVPLTVYGWPGITIQEIQYPFWPKANTAWTKYTMLGDYWTDHPSFFWGTDNRYDYTDLGLFFVTRRPDGLSHYYYSIYAYRNKWVNTAWSFDLSSRTLVGYINGNKVYSATVPSTEVTVLEWNPDTATYPLRYKRLVLGANVMGSENMKLMQAQLLVYNRVLSQSEIIHNYRNPNNPVRDGLILWLDARNVSGNKWYDLSGYGNHGTIYGAIQVSLPNPLGGW